MLDQLGQVYVLLDVQGNVIEANDAFLTMVGYSREEVLGQRGFEMFTPPSDRANRQRQFAVMIATETLEPIYQRPVLIRGGHPRLMHWRTGFTREAGTITGVWMVGQEPGPTSMATPTLTGNSTHLQDFLDNAQDLVQHLSADNNFLFVNKAWKEKLGYTDAEPGHPHPGRRGAPLLQSQAALPAAQPLRRRAREQGRNRVSDQRGQAGAPHWQHERGARGGPAGEQPRDSARHHRPHQGRAPAEGLLQHCQPGHLGQGLAQPLRGHSPRVEQDY
ncbi:PAS domain-containing protein [Hymenobacter humi]|uniref:PAS domain-containing protein n=1 Tax=Hymenobacter humi TaxID=1411620 RepID=A0ABW2UCL1_9BACT